MTSMIFETPEVVEAAAPVEKEEKVVNYVLHAEILNTNTDEAESLTEVEAITVESVSKISAEDRARRFFRKNNVPMDHVVRDVISETEATWSGFVGEVPEDRQPVKTEKAPAKPRKSALTPEKVLETNYEELTNLFLRWKDEKDYEGWTDYQTRMRMIAKAQGWKLVEFTNRPFQMKFRIGKDETVYTVGRDSQAHFVLK